MTRMNNRIATSNLQCSILLTTEHQILPSTASGAGMLLARDTMSINATYGIDFVRFALLWF